METYGLSKTKVKLGLIVILVVFALGLVFSQDANPDKPMLFGLKRVQEKAYLKLKSTPEQKINYMIFLLDSRLKELESVVHNQSYTYVLPAAQRYSTLAGEITEIVTSNNLTTYKEEISKLFTNHKVRLQELYVFYPKNTENLEYKYIEDDINYLDIYLEKLSK